MASFHPLNSTHLDVLKEVGNIGAGHSATALSQLLNRRIDMKVPDVQLISFNDMMDIVGGVENIVVSIFLRVTGDVPGSMFVILPLEEAGRLVQEILQDDSVSSFTPPFSDLSLSALAEIGNILAGSYISSLSDLTKLQMMTSVPSLCVDMAGAVIGNGLVEVSHSSDSAIMIDTVIYDDEGQTPAFKGHFLLIPDPVSLLPLFSALGVADHV
ncbi:MAG TPA: chemotaxis protein CheC [Bacillus sp. (in: firmicutes)]|nr:chemotaxis protein CheC [Bacillus sp. (in: firmicutes)]